MEQKIENDKVLPGEEVRAMFYGMAGVGKTELLSTAQDDPRTSPTLLISSEAGLRTIRHRIRYVEVKDLGNPLQNSPIIDVVDARDLPKIQRVSDFLFKSIYEKKRLMYKSVSLDSFTEVNTICLRHVMEKSNEVKLDPDVPEQRDYLKTNSMMKDLIRAFRDMEGLHCFYSALQDWKQDNPKDDDSPTWVTPAMIGKLSREAVAMLDYVGFMRAKTTGQREMLFQPEGKVVAKERSRRDMRIVSLKDPTITTIMDAIEGKTKKEGIK